MKKRNWEINSVAVCVLLYAILAVLCITAWFYRATGEIHYVIALLAIVLAYAVIDIWHGMFRSKPEYMRKLR